MISDTPEHGAAHFAEQTSPEEVHALENLLRDWQGWMSAEAVLGNRFIAATENNKRKLRATAAESKWIISGQRGYKHLQQATPDEVKHFVAQMSSQSRKMDARVQAIETNYRKIYQAI